MLQLLSEEVLSDPHCARTAFDTVGLVAAVEPIVTFLISMTSSPLPIKDKKCDKLLDLISQLLRHLSSSRNTWSPMDHISEISRNIILGDIKQEVNGNNENGRNFKVKDCNKKEKRYKTKAKDSRAFKEFKDSNKSKSSRTEVKVKDRKANQYTCYFDTELIKR
mmetsp:Transcript_1772/g.2273  ORF Transcript_1772/g.2273 Transcript_1772/m.2273 type:complete len:164 (-) Transcript_1772:139-630(-)